jgi:ATP-dependent DNA helicase RecG
MKFIEDQNVDYKSLKHAIGQKANLTALAETCVCFANAQGGKVVIGIENGQIVPPVGQKVDIDRWRWLSKSRNYYS